METAELEKLIKGRRSIRFWDDKPVPEELLLKAVELASWAPNGANAQIWNFYIVLDKSKIKAIGDAAAANMKNMMSWPEMANFKGFTPPPPPPGVEPPPPPKRSPLSDAPAMILIGAKRRENPMDKMIAERAKTDEQAAQRLQWSGAIDSRIQSVASGIGYLLLVLHQMGLGATWMTGPISQAKGDIEKILNVPPDVDIIALVPVGYSTYTPVSFRKLVNDVCQVIK
ncbi:MAG: nitroreductase family protein [Deltaproteobacteria bacterium]|nr:nitroreductase family protein [Deltaproteobacteria bacterium]